MKIVVYGLGIIGASIAASCRRAGHTVLGKNRSGEPIDYALAHGIIDGEAKSYKGADVVFLALPPRVAMRVLCEECFPEGIVVADVCGVKEVVEKAVLAAPRTYRYVGTHPMAGKETSGIRSASETLFDGANFVLTRYEGIDEGAVALVKKLAGDMGFSRIVECSARRHDEMIALTSQLAHVVSSAYVKSPLTAQCEGFTGGSFQDMTRVAGIDEVVWTELFELNRDRLLPEIDGLIQRLTQYRDALASGNGDGMRALLKEGREFRREYILRNRTDA